MCFNTQSSALKCSQSSQAVCISAIIVNNPDCALLFLHICKLRRGSEPMSETIAGQTSYQHVICCYRCVNKHALRPSLATALCSTSHSAARVQLTEAVKTLYAAAVGTKAYLVCWAATSARARCRSSCNRSAVAVCFSACSQQQPAAKPESRAGLSAQVPNYCNFSLL